MIGTFARGAWITFLVPLSLISPLYLLIAGTPVFVIQTPVVVLAITWFVLYHRPRALTRLDQIVLLYLAWSIISFAINMPFLVVSQGREALYVKQFTSLLMTLLGASPYLLGRCYFASDRAIGRFVLVGAGGYALVIISYGIFYYLNMADLYLARRTIQQRVPMMIVLVGWAICSLGFRGRQPRKWLICLWLGGLAIAALSLTRAAYIQWAASALAFSVLTFARRDARKALFLWLCVLLLVGAFVYSSAPVQELDVTRSLADRFGQLLALHETASSELSANTRLNMWKEFFEEFVKSPLRLVVGFGQLGPGSIGKYFYTNFGEYLAGYNAHNEYLDSLVRSGIPGLSLEVLLMATVIFAPFTQRRLACAEMDFFRSHSVALFGVMVYGMFHETLRWQMFAFYFWLYAGILSSHLYSGEACSAGCGQGPRPGSYRESPIGSIA